jgi:hypothetical protein
MGRTLWNSSSSTRRFTNVSHLEGFLVEGAKTKKNDALRKNLLIGGPIQTQIHGAAVGAPMKPAKRICRAGEKKKEK